MGEKTNKANIKAQPEMTLKSSQQSGPADDGRGSRRRSILIIAAALALLAGALLFLRNESHIGAPVRAGRCRDCNVLFVTWDTTRADHLPIYGYRGVKTPNLDELAKDSNVFEDAISQSPLTLPSHTSMMTGRLPIGHGVRDNAGFFLNQKETTLAEAFKKAGYATAAFVSTFVLDSRWQLNQGFDLYYDNFNLSQFQDLNLPDIQRRAEETETEFSHWMDGHKDGKFFCWVHFYDPHDPYDPPEPFRTEYADNLYDGEIAYTDAVFGRMLSKLRELGLSNRTIIVMAADHGEGLGEHDEATHAIFLYDTTQHVPLVLHIPGAGARRVKGVVSLIDVAPTLLELTGLPAVKEMQGKTLIPKINGSERQERKAYSESIYAEIHYGWSAQEAVTTDDYKYIDAPRPELYDRLKDRGETTNIMAAKDSIGSALRSDLQDMAARNASKNLPGPQKTDPDTEEKLRTLGYIGSTAGSTVASRQIDPKDKIHLVRAIQRAFDSLQKQQYEKALEDVEPVLKEDPQMVDAHFAAGVACIGLGRLDPAIEELLRALSFRPDDTRALYDLAYAYELKGDLTEAEKWYQKVLRYEPMHLFASLKVAHIYRKWNQEERARGYFLTAAAAYERALGTTRDEKARAAVYSMLGEIYFAAGDLSKAELNFQSAIRLVPGHNLYHFNLAQIFEARGQVPEAIEAYREEIRVDPGSFKAYNNLGLLYENTNRLDDAVPCFRKVIELDEKDPRGYVLLSGIYRKMGREQDAVQVLRMAREHGIPID